MSAEVRDVQVTVVIPTLNRAKWLSRSVAAALSQVEVELEVIVIADGPSNEAEPVVRALEDPRLRYVVLPVRSGVSAARNAGIDLARGDWVAFLDDDDVWAPTKLRRQIEVGATADVVYTGVALLDDTGRLSAVLSVPDHARLAEALRETNVLSTPSCVMVKTSLLRRLNGFDTRAAVLADWDLWLRLVASARVACCPEPLTGYTVHRQGMHARAPRKLRRELRYLRRVHRLAGHADIGGYPFREWLAWSYRNAGQTRSASRAYLQLGMKYRRPRHVARGLALLFGERFTRILRRLVPATTVHEGAKTSVAPELLADLLVAARWS
jgi:glycosyltransferase involved in cell wall biosynthesis